MGPQPVGQAAAGRRTTLEAGVRRLVLALEEDRVEGLWVQVGVERLAVGADPAVHRPGVDEVRLAGPVVARVDVVVLGAPRRGRSRAPGDPWSPSGAAARRCRGPPGRHRGRAASRPRRSRSARRRRSARASRRTTRGAASQSMISGSRSSRDAATRARRGGSRRSRRRPSPPAPRRTAGCPSPARGRPRCRWSTWMRGSASTSAASSSLKTSASSGIVFAVDPVEEADPLRAGRELVEVQGARERRRRGEPVGVAEGQLHRAVAAHREPGDVARRVLGDPEEVAHDLLGSSSAT